MAGLVDGVLVGEGQDLSQWACGRCDLTAVPLLFDDEASRKKFEAARAKDPSASWPASGWPSLKKPLGKS
ncbi:MAG: hypothetical protein QOJ26_1896 [Thermoplasmata archaeon]|jgi:hypothetical protein|nr:hypothetical protein [Thermoplasmata archaeon]MEA3167012.1 hypothetical protein [Thermoplasmata archaeon]